jgi:hypothetical protein
VTAAAAAVLVFGQLPAFAWTIDVVDGNELDGLGRVAISLSDHVWAAWPHTNSDDLFWAGSSWSVTQVGGVGTIGDCQELDAGFVPTDGTARLVSSCQGHSHRPGTIRWTYRDPATGLWSSTTLPALPSGLCQGMPIDLRLLFDRATGAPGVAFEDSEDGHVYWYRSDGSSWTLEDVGTVAPDGVCQALGGGLSAAIDPTTGQPAIVWSTVAGHDPTADLMYATRGPSGGWTATRIYDSSTGGPAVSPSIAFGPDGTSWVAFTQGSLSPYLPSHLEVATAAGSKWTFTTVDAVNPTAGLTPSIAMKGSLPRIASRQLEANNISRSDLRWAAYSGTTWTLSTLDTGFTAYSPTVAFSSTLDPYIVYGDTDPISIVWARPSH